MGSIWKVCACTNGFIPVDERDRARMQFLRHFENRHDCWPTAHFSVMNCSSTGSFYEREFSPWRPLVHKNRVRIWFISRWPFTNGRAPFTNGQFGRTGNLDERALTYKTVQIKTPNIEFWREAQTDEKSPKFWNKCFLIIDHRCKRLSTIVLTITVPIP